MATAQLLIQIGDVPGVARPLDGDVIVVKTAFEIARVHAERIALGRGPVLRGSARMVIRGAWRLLTRDGRRPLTPAQTAELWRVIETATGGRLLRADHRRFPFTPVERRTFLVVPLDADLSAALRSAWEAPQVDRDGRVLRYRRSYVDWRSEIVNARGLASEADVLDRRKHVDLAGELPTRVVAQRESL